MSTPCESTFRSQPSRCPTNTNGKHTKKPKQKTKQRLKTCVRVGEEKRDFLLCCIYAVVRQSYFRPFRRATMRNARFLTAQLCRSAQTWVRKRCSAAHRKAYPCYDASFSLLSSSSSPPLHCTQVRQHNYKRYKELHDYWDCAGLVFLRLHPFADCWRLSGDAVWGQACVWYVVSYVASL